VRGDGDGPGGGAELRAQIERRWIEHELARLDLREVEHIVDHPQQGVGRAADRLEILALHERQARLEREIGHADDAVHRRPDLVAHVREEHALGAAGVFGGIAGVHQLARALGDERGELALARLELAHAESHHEGYADGRDNREREAEPERFIEVRLHRHRQHRARPVDDVFAVGGANPETIRAGREIGIGRRALTVGVHPVLVDALEPVLHDHVRRIEEAQGREPDLEPLRAGRDGDGGGDVARDVIDQQLFDDERRRDSVTRHRERLDAGEPVQGGKPQHVANAAARRLRSAAVFAAREAELLPVVGAGDLEVNLLRDVVELVARHANQAGAGRHPEIAVGVLQNLQD
jgi:hypothetical protein